MAPKISPFNFGSEDSLNLGDSVSTQCSITVGDSPISIQWYLNGQPITDSFQDISVTKLGKKAVALAIDSVNAKHVGSYMCVAKNAAGVVSFTSELIVNGIYLTNLIAKISSF